MNQNILKIVMQHEKEFVPLIFTRKQLNVLVKRSKGMALNSTEKKALYTSIRKKAESLELVSENMKEKEIYITGHGLILPERAEEAKKILRGYSEKYSKVFIAGSFLFSKDYNDIDIFIIREKGYKERWEGNHHLVFVSEKRLEKPIFQSAAKISISVFPIPSKLTKKRPRLSDIMSTYHESVIECMNKEKKPEMTRHLIFDYYLLCKSYILDPKNLQELAKSASLDNLATYIKELSINLFSKSYLYVGIHWYVQTLEKDIKSTKHNKNLVEYKKTYEELLYGRQRDKEAIT